MAAGILSPGVEMKGGLRSVCGKREIPGRHRLYAGMLAALVALAAGGVAHAQQDVEPAPRQYTIAAGRLGDALNQLARQSSLQIVYAPELVRGKAAPALDGRFTWREALQTLLAESGLEWGFVNDTTVVIRPRSASVDAQTQAGPRSTPAHTPPAPSRVQELQTLTVTGTRIRGGDTPSPVITIGSERIQEEGFNDLGEVIRSVVQNFGGGQNPEVAVGATLGAGGIANQNVTGGSALNLRGLGPDATLTLLNGRRLAYGGFVQAVDISAIPVEAVERIEIVPDGASAIYGSDAVGGVGNVVLKRDYDGVVVGGRYGGATEGGLSTREYTITAGSTWSGGGLIATYKDVSTAPIYARQRDYTAHMFHPTTLRADSSLRSGLVSAHQSITESVEFQLDMLRSERSQEYYRSNTGLQPWYNRYQPRTTTTLISPNIEIALPLEWTLSVGGSRGRDEHVGNQSRVNISTGVPTTIDHGCFCNESLSYEIGAEGPLFSVPGGDARLAIGVGARRNELTQYNYLTDAIGAWGEDRSRFAYAELHLPLIAPRSNIAGAHRLELTAAVRGEDYDSFGGVTTPKIGLIYAPGADLTLRASWGRSFKAPMLFQRWSQYAILDPASYYGGVGHGTEATVLAVLGGNPDLEAERATTWAASVAVHPAALPNFQAELTWFDIDYMDRVVQPITNYAQALVLPEYDQFIDWSPTVQALEQAIAAADAFYNLSGGPYDPGNVVALMYGQYINVARQRVSGVDVAASYRFDLGSGRLTLRGSSSWLESTRQNNAVQSPYQVAGTIFNPSKLNSRVGLVWNQGGLIASAFANHTGGVTNTVNGEKTASFSTVDAALRYATDQTSGAFSGLEFALSAQNLLDRDPPLYAAAALDRPPYDSTNFSAVGRFVSVSVHKRW